MIFLSGSIGAFARETFRWRTLYLAGRIKKYTQPAYLGIAMAIVILGGLTSLIFTSLLPKSAQLPGAFVLGAGLELAVQQAARLRMPRVPLGNESSDTAEEPATIDEFLRQ
jgi:hypothetical protein